MLLKKNILCFALFFLMYVSVFSQNKIVDYKFNGSLEDMVSVSNNLQEFGSGNSVIYSSGTTSFSGDSSAKFNFGKGLESLSAIDNSAWNGIAVSVWAKSCKDGTIFQGNAFGPGVVVDAQGKLSVFFDGSSSNSLSTSNSVNINDGSWHHIVAQNNGSQTQIFIDGELDVIQNETMYKLTGFNSLAKIYLGTNSSETRKLSGEIDNFQLFDDTLSNAEIQNLYSTKFASLVVTENISQLVAYPNPSTEKIVLKSLPAGASSLKITDLHGRVMFVSSKVNENIMIEELDNGVYYIQVYNNKKLELGRTKFLKVN